MKSKKSQSRGGGDSEEEKRMRLPLRTPSRRTAIPNQNRMSLKPSRPAGTARNRCLAGKESECHQGKNKEEWSWAGSDEEIKKPIAGDWRWTNTGEAVLVEVETTRQTETSGQVENVMDVQRGMTNGQSLQPLVDHRPRWKIRWQKHTELQGKEVDRILKQENLGARPGSREEDSMKRAFNTRLGRPSGGSLVVSAQRRFGTGFSALDHQE